VSFAWRLCRSYESVPRWERIILCLSAELFREFPEDIRWDSSVVLHTEIVNDREFRQHLVKLRLERKRKEARAATAVKKPPVTAKSQKAKKKRSA
jgi:hypothetical protein